MKLYIIQKLQITDNFVRVEKKCGLDYGQATRVLLLSYEAQLFKFTATSKLSVILLSQPRTWNNMPTV